MSYVWNRGGQPLVGAPPPAPPNTNRIPRGVIAPSGQLDLNHYSASKIRNLQAAYASPSVRPLNTAWAGLTNLAYGTWGFEGPDDAEQTTWAGTPEPGYPEKGALHGSGQPANVGGGGYAENVSSTLLFTTADSMSYIMSQLPTVVNNTNGSGTRFGYSTAKGLPSILKNCQTGDARQHSGLRAGVAYDAYPIVDGETHWFGWAWYLTSDFLSLGMSSGVAQLMWATHTTQNSPGYTGVPATVNWYDALNGSSVSGNNLWAWTVSRTAFEQQFRYKWAPNINGWQRVAIEYCSGAASSNPIFNMWVANGTGAFSQLVAVADPYSGTTYAANQPFGVPAGGTSGEPDYTKFENYNVGTPAISSVTAYTTGLFAEKQVSSSLLANAEAALIPWAA